MKSFLRKSICMMLVVTMIATLTACKVGDSDATESNGAVTNVMDKEHVFKEQMIDLGENFDELSTLGLVDDKVVLVTAKWDESFMAKIWTLDKTGNVMSSAEIPQLDEEGWFMQFKVLKDGKVYSLRQSSYEDNSDPDNYVYISKYFLSCYNQNGERIWDTEIDFGGEEDYYSPSGIFAIDEETLGISTDTSIVLFNALGEQKDMIPLGENYQGISGIKVKEDGKVYFMAYDNEWTKQFQYCLDISTGQIDNIGEVPAFVSTKGCYASTEYDYYLGDTYGISGYRIGDEQETFILDYLASDIATNGIDNFYKLDDSSYIGSYSDIDEYKRRISIFTKVAPEDVVEKTVLTMAGYYVNTDVRKRVIDFNKNNAQYRISIKDYSQYSNSGDWNAGSQKFNSDIASGNIPDILLMNSYNVNWDNYVSKGLFYNLGELIDKDTEIKREDFCPNVLEAQSTNDKIYALSPTFSVRTYVAKKSLVGDRLSWTFDDVNRLLADMPEGTELLAEQTQDGFLYEAMHYNMSTFVDFVNHTCNFETEEFYNILKMMKEYPKEINYEEDYSDEYWMNAANMYRENRIILSPMSIYDFREVKRTSLGSFGEEISFIGFPTSENVGSVLEVYEAYAISAKSKYVDEAWQFVRQLFTEEYQDSIEYELPIRKSSLEKLAGKAMEKPYYIDSETQEKVEYDDTYWNGDEEIIIDPMTEEELQTVLDFVYSVNRKSSNLEEIQNIINEEAASFLDGQKSVEEVSKIIQSRVQIYLSENS